MTTRFVLGAIWILVNLATARADRPRFLILGEDIGPRDVSADGSVVVGDIAFGLFNSGGFRWTAEDGIVVFDPPPGSQNIVTKAWGVSADGNVVVGVHNDGLGPQVFRWTQQEGMEVLGDLPGGIVRATAYGASADGSVIVGLGASEMAQREEAFRWTRDTGMVGMGDLPGSWFSSWAFDITPDASVIVGLSIGEHGEEAFRWTGETGIVGLGGLPAVTDIYGTQAQSISADGSTIVGVGDSLNGREAFRWTAEAGMVGLGDLPGGSFGSRAWDVSGDGSIIVGEGRSDTTHDNAFIWDARRGLRPLSRALTDEFGIPEAADYLFLAATGISDDGRTIIGGVAPRVGRFDNYGFVAFLGSPAADCPADLNGDGSIDLADLARLLVHFGDPNGAEPANGDLDADGDVDLSDLGLMLSVFGTSCG